MEQVKIDRALMVSQCIAILVYAEVDVRGEEKKRRYNRLAWEGMSLSVYLLCSPYHLSHISINIRPVTCERGCPPVGISA